MESCARCGSSCSFEHCWNCEDGYVWVDVGDGIVEDEELALCDVCGGRGGWSVCLSSKEWCAANPMPGCEAIERGSIETFEVFEKDDTRGCVESFEGEKP